MYNVTWMMQMNVFVQSCRKESNINITIYKYRK